MSENWFWRINIEAEKWGQELWPRIARFMVKYIFKGVSEETMYELIPAWFVLFLVIAVIVWGIVKAVKSRRPEE